MSRAKNELASVNSTPPAEWFRFEPTLHGCGYGKLSKEFQNLFGPETMKMIYGVRHFVIDHSLEKIGNKIQQVPFETIVARNPKLQPYLDTILQRTGFTFLQIDDVLEEMIINPGDPRLEQPDLS